MRPAPSLDDVASAILDCAPVEWDTVEASAEQIEAPLIQQLRTLAKLRLVSRQTLALVCGAPDSVDAFARRLYLAGLPRNQLLADVFLPRG